METNWTHLNRWILLMGLLATFYHRVILLVVRSCGTLERKNYWTVAMDLRIDALRLNNKNFTAFLINTSVVIGGLLSGLEGINDDEQYYFGALQIRIIIVAQ